MSIYTARQVVIICDVCGFVEGEDFTTQRQAIKEKRQEGWSIGKKVKCPKCKEGI